MREIKFRAWADGKMWYPDKKREDWWFFGTGGYWSLNHGLEIEKILCDSLESDNPVLMQFTGLKDQKGVEIFEGDILMIHNPPHQIQRMELICTVKYLPGAWYAIVRKTNIWDHYRVERLEKGYEILLVNIADEKPIRIIGNTFENPNLI
jgi:uncharacterized phage protein (TIGR01671 family)